MILDNRFDPSASTTTLLPDYHTTQQEALALPRYWTHERPARPVTYTFTHWHASTNTMLLIPPPSSSSSFTYPPPKYRITTSLNLHPFLPVSYVTNIHMLGNTQADDVLLGKFEMPMNSRRGVLTKGDLTAQIEKVLEPRSLLNDHHWRWYLQDVALKWDCRARLEDGSVMCICYIANTAKTQIATFIPPPVLASPPLPDPVLTVFPDGHEFFDHILISALILVRMLIS